MNQNRLILSPCGTSTLTNGAESALRKLLTDCANATEASLDSAKRAEIDARVEVVRQKLLTCSPKEAKSASAELNSLMTFYNDQIAPRDIHLLIATDTYIGKKTASLVEAYLRRMGAGHVEILTSGGLRTEDLSAFEAALSDLTRQLDEQLQGYHDSGYEIIFNLTGGFKSIQGFLQTLSMFYADQTIYIFETGNKLLTIPKLPIKLDDLAHFEAHMAAYRRLSLELELDKAQKAQIAPIYSFSIDDEMMLSGLGEAAFKEAQRTLYEQKLFESPTPKIRYGEKLRKQKLDAKRVCDLNTSIDDLARNLETGVLLKRTDFKPLTGEPKKGITHEFYLNSDDAERGYCFYQGDVLVIDHVGPHT